MNPKSQLQSQKSRGFWDLVPTPILFNLQPCDSIASYHSNFTCFFKGKSGSASELAELSGGSRLVFRRTLQISKPQVANNKTIKSTMIRTSVVHCGTTHNHSPIKQFGSGSGSGEGWGGGSVVFLGSRGMT